MGNAPSSSTRSGSGGSTSTTAPSGSTSASNAGASGSTTAGPSAPSTFASLTSRARARTKSSSVPLTASQVLASEPLVDGGHTLPLGLYQLAPAWDFSREVVRRLIQDRRMAPFYLGLEDWEDDWAEADIVKGLREARFAVDKKRQVLREAGEPTGEVDPAAGLSANKAAALAAMPARLKEGATTEVERREAEWFTDSTAECPLYVRLSRRPVSARCQGPSHAQLALVADFPACFLGSFSISCFLVSFQSLPMAQELSRSVG